MSIEKTVAAVSTPPGTGGISVIRISGENAIDIADKCFKSYDKIKLSEMNGYTCAYGKIINKNGEKIDSGVATVFRAPHSYTGENTVEISCHGGEFVTREVLRALLDSGAEMAGAGEFTKRAFLNGKLSLDRAEAVMDIISAGSATELKLANMEKSGRAAQKIQEFENTLTDILGRLSVWADYPDDDIPEVTHESLIPELDELLGEMRLCLKTYDYGQRIKHGIKTVIIGEPNVGKSTFFNYLVGEERSIVTDIAGTTRDVIEESVNIGKVTLRLFDTAGLHQTEDKIEKIGIENVFKKIDEAELVLLIIDGSKNESEFISKIEDKIKGKEIIAVINKSDLKSNFDISKIKKLTDNIVNISAKNRTGIEDLEKILSDKFLGSSLNAEHGWIANDRQKLCLENSINSVEDALEKTKAGETLDIITVILDEALDYLLKLEGKKVTEEVVDNVFENFCVGK